MASNYILWLSIFALDYLKVLSNQIIKNQSTTGSALSPLLFQNGVTQSVLTGFNNGPDAGVSASIYVVDSLIETLPLIFLKLYFGVCSLYFAFLLIFYSKWFIYVFLLNNCSRPHLTTLTSPVLISSLPPIVNTA